MGAFAAWLADLARKYATWLPVLTLMLGAIAVYSAFYGTYWAVVNVSIPYSGQLVSALNDFSQFISEKSSQVPFAIILYAFGVDTALNYFITLLEHLLSIVGGIGGLFSGIVTLLGVVYTYQKAKWFSAIISGSNLVP